MVSVTIASFCPILCLEYRQWRIPEWMNGYALSEDIGLNRRARVSYLWLYVALCLRYSYMTSYCIFARLTTPYTNVWCQYSNLSTSAGALLNKHTWNFKRWCQKHNCRQLFQPNWALSVQCSTTWASHLNRRPKAPMGFNKPEVLKRSFVKALKTSFNPSRLH